MGKRDKESGLERVRRRLEEKIRAGVSSLTVQEDLIAFLDLYESECHFAGFREGYAEAMKAIIEREDDE